MRFFVPAAEDDAPAERVYKSIAEFCHAPAQARRIHRLHWRHKGMEMSCEVGGTLPSYYQTGVDVVLSIFDCGNLYKIATPNRGGVRGEPIFAGKDRDSRAEYFSAD
jgi:hypothetical protein